MSKKEAATSSTVVMRTLLLNSKPFFVLFDSGATHSFISTRSTMHLNLEDRRMENNYRIKLPNDSVIECAPSLTTFFHYHWWNHLPMDLIQIDLSNFEIILE